MSIATRDEVFESLGIKVKPKAKKKTPSPALASQVNVKSTDWNEFKTDLDKIDQIIQDSALKKAIKKFDEDLYYLGGYAKLIPMIKPYSFIPTEIFIRNNYIILDFDLPKWNNEIIASDALLTNALPDATIQNIEKPEEGKGVAM